jgi:hypothetical protein
MQTCKSNMHLPNVLAKSWANSSSLSTLWTCIRIHTCLYMAQCRPAAQAVHLLSFKLHASNAHVIYTVMHTPTTALKLTIHTLCAATSRQLQCLSLCQRLCAMLASFAPAKCHSACTTIRVHSCTICSHGWYDDHATRICIHLQFCTMCMSPLSESDRACRHCAYSKSTAMAFHTKLDGVTVTGQDSPAVQCTDNAWSSQHHTVTVRSLSSQGCAETEVRSEEET